jgi:hypothetical protein
MNQALDVIISIIKSRSMRCRYVSRMEDKKYIQNIGEKVWGEENTRKT